MGLITHCDSGPGNIGDTDAARALIAEAAAGTENLGATGYSAGEFRDHLDRCRMTPFIKPQPFPAAVAGGYFTIDLHAMTVTCPEQVTVTISRPRFARFGTACNGCRVCQRCINAKAGRVIKVHPKHALLAAAACSLAPTTSTTPTRRFAR